MLTKNEMNNDIEQLKNFCKKLVKEFQEKQIEIKEDKKKEEKQCQNQ